MAEEVRLDRGQRGNKEDQESSGRQAGGRAVAETLSEGRRSGSKRGFGERE